MNSARAPLWLSSYLVPFVTLSYPTDRPAEPDSFPTANYYTTGILDACLIVTCIAVMAVLRDATRLMVMEPFARWFLSRKYAFARDKEATNGGIPDDEKTSHDLARTRKLEDRMIQRSVLRFAEQGWSVIYYSVNFTFGLYLHCNFPTAPFHLEKLWLNYPHIPLAGPVKLYYLLQTSFYMHQVLVLNAEARRKDHIQMMTHHVISIALMVASYFGHFTRIGCLIMVLMDWCDIFFPLAKMFRYLALPTLCDATFVWFLVSWLVTRHILFMLAIRSLFADAPRFVPLEWSPEQGRFLSYESWIAFLALLIALQFIQLLWFYMICRVAWRVISGQGAEDTRSDEDNQEDALEVDAMDNPSSAPQKELKKRGRRETRD